jgi:hypothetical protein
VTTTTTIQTSEGQTIEGPVSTLTPSYLQQNYMLGLDFVDTEGNPYPSSFYVTHINNAIDE